MPAVALLRRAACVLACALAVLCAVSLVHATDAHKQQHALMVAIPLPGHLNPLVSQALALRRRGWSITLASASRMQDHLEAAIRQADKEVQKVKERDPQAAAEYGTMRYMNLGDCAESNSLKSALVESASHDNFMESGTVIFEWILTQHSCMYTALAGEIAKLPALPSVIVSDFATYAGFDIADNLGIPLVINNPDLLNMLFQHDLPPHDFSPASMVETSLVYHNSSSSGYGLMQRVLFPPLRILIRIIARYAENKLHEEQSLAGVPHTPLFERMTGKLILVNNAFGIEYSRPLPPHIVMVGHMLDKPWRRDLQVARAEYVEELAEEDRAWLEGDLPVVWVSMGTIAPLNERQVRALYAAFERGTREGRFRVLWKVPKSDLQYLPAESERPPAHQLRILQWVSSQLGVLAHSSTRVFLSHCGINSVHESVYLEKPLLCIPIIADQRDMAGRVVDANLGVYLHKAKFTSDDLLSTLLGLLTPANQTAYGRGLELARASMLLTGGADRAANYIEYAAAHGVKALVPVEQTHPWWIRQNWDVYAVWAMMLVTLLAVNYCMCCKCRPGKECTKSRRKNRAASPTKEE